MESKSFLLAAALTLGTTAQTTSVMELFLDTDESPNATFVGSVISAAPEATTYAVRGVPGAGCTDEMRNLEKCEYNGDPLTLTRLYVNGPSTFARHFTIPDVTTWDTEYNITSQYYDCEMTVATPSGVMEVFTTSRMLLEQDTISAVRQVTITAGLEKILAVTTTSSSATSAQTAASASSGPSQTVASTSPGPSETSDSATATSSSSSASMSSTTESAAEIATFRNISLAVFCGLIALALGL